MDPAESRSDWQPENETERMRRMARDMNFMDRLLWLEEASLLAAQLQEARMKQGLPTRVRDDANNYDDL